MSGSVMSRATSPICRQLMSRLIKLAFHGLHRNAQQASYSNCRNVAALAAA
jgi:hypothetical protein